MWLSDRKGGVSRLSTRIREGCVEEAEGQVGIRDQSSGDIILK